MRTFKWVLAMAAVIGFAAVLAVAYGAAAEPAGKFKVTKDVTVTGEVIDIYCYAMEGVAATGEAHKECATKCMKAGLPAGILEVGTDKVFLAAGPDDKTANDVLGQYVAQKVTAKGDLLEGNGASLFIVKEVAAAK